MRPTAQQLAVIESDDRDILVEAGAGSGKTTTTVNRYIRLVAERGYEPREILAFTFTDKAAGELRDKVRRACRRLAEERGDPNPQAFSMSSAWVGTFHSICSRILKAYPLEAGVDPNFAVIDDVTAETVRGQAFDEALIEFRGTGPDRQRREAMIGLFTERTLRESTLATFDELRSRGIERPSLPEFADTPYPAEKIEYLRAQVSAVAGIKGLHWSHKPKAAELERLLHRPGDVALTCSELARVHFVSSHEDCEKFCRVLTETVAELAAHEDGDFARRGLGRLLELFGERFTRLKARRSVLDYEDLQLMTLRLLRDNHRIRDAYQDRFREIMVDEFQDTNQLQLDLVTELRGESTTLMTVGDEMQSIYGFRHADVELFRQRRVAPGVSKFRLSDNFRSKPEVIAAINEIGVTLDRQVKANRDSELASRHEFSELTVGLPETDASASATAILTGRGGWKPLDLGEIAPAVPPEAEVGKDQDHYCEAEALRVARHLRELVDAGIAKQGEIAILLRAWTRAELYVAALRSVGLSPYLTGGSAFWSSREATDLRSLLSVIANPLEDDALLGALVSPACGVSSNALWLLRRASPAHSPLWPTVRAAAGDPPPEGSAPEWLDQIPADDRQAILAFVGRLDRLRSRAGTIPLAALVEEAVTATGYDLASLIRDPTRNGMASIRRVASLADEYEAAEGRDLRGFLSWVSLSAELDTESSVPTEEEESDVIRIMTVHAAKGLEFKVACVPDCGRRNDSRHSLPIRLGRTRSGDPLDFPIGLRLPRIDGEKIDLYDWTELAERARLADEDEELRLFHVALTRAEDHLIVSGVLPERAPKNISSSLPMISRFAAGFGIDPEEPDGWPEVVPEGSDPTIRIVANMASPETAEVLRSGRRSPVTTPPARSGVPPIHRPEQKVFPNVPLSFTALSEYEDCPARFFAKRVLRLEEPSAAPSSGPSGDPLSEPMVGRDRATAFGSAVHDELERLGKARWSRPRDERIAAALEKRGADPGADLPPARRMIDGFLGSDLGRRVQAGDASFEVPLLLRTGPVTIRGFVDVLVNGPVPLVLDYKTNRLRDATPEQKMAEYVQQRNLYALAIARARRVNQVETAFVFLERPDQPVIDVLDAEDLNRAEAELQATLEDITAGRYLGQPESTRQQCRECWACAALERQLATGDPLAADPRKATGPVPPTAVP